MTAAAAVGIASSSTVCYHSDGGEEGTTSAAAAGAAAAAAAAAAASVGDFLGTLGKLRSLLRRMHYPAVTAAAATGSEWCSSSSEQEAVAAGAVDALLPIIHFAVCDFSPNVHSFLRRRGFEFLFKSDKRFVEEVWKFLRQECGYRPALTASQFLTPVGFAERKLLLCCDLLTIVRAIHNQVQLDRRRAKTLHQHQQQQQQQQKPTAFMLEETGAPKKAAASPSLRSSSGSFSYRHPLGGEQKQQQEQQQQQQQHQQGSSSRSGSAPVPQARLAMPAAAIVPPAAFSVGAEQRVVSALLQNVASSVSSLQLSGRVQSAIDDLRVHMQQLERRVAAIEKKQQQHDAAAGVFYPTTSGLPKEPFAAPVSSAAASCSCACSRRACCAASDIPLQQQHGATHQHGQQQHKLQLLQQPQPVSQQQQQILHYNQHLLLEQQRLPHQQQQVQQLQHQQLQPLQQQQKHLLMQQHVLVPHAGGSLPLNDWQQTTSGHAAPGAAAAPNAAALSSATTAADEKLEESVRRISQKIQALQGALHGPSAADHSAVCAAACGAVAAPVAAAPMASSAASAGPGAAACANDMTAFADIAAAAVAAAAATEGKVSGRAAPPAATTTQLEQPPPSPSLFPAPGSTLAKSGNSTHGSIQLPPLQHELPVLHQQNWPGDQQQPQQDDVQQRPAEQQDCHERLHVPQFGTAGVYEVSTAAAAEGGVTTGAAAVNGPLVASDVGVQGCAAEKGPEQQQTRQQQLLQETPFFGLGHSTDSAVTEASGSNLRQANNSVGGSHTFTGAAPLPVWPPYLQL
ncbi:hypothetical protein, conserved [Eimeria maxima]|uniref:Centrosomal protein of 44 kDa n=1 Tax=Eimeria maxima TaxID=5804 RepID=U6M1L6_EIMMA|nr:hypothetical protein, conserved [Eimeria maxima]CDJ57916.1 hypothetical protein, conserved [Eimeria maxima]